MGLFSKIGNLFSNKSPTGTVFKLITERGNGFYDWNGRLFQSDVIRSCIRPKAAAIGKLEAQHIRKGPDGIKVNPETYMRFLLEEPNPYMSGQMMQEKLTNQLQLNNNAFALVIRDSFDYPTGIYPITCTTVQSFFENETLKFRFTLRNGQTLTAAYIDIIHLRRDFNSNDLFGESLASTLKMAMEVVNTTDQGIIKAVKNSNVIRWILDFKSKMRPEDKELEIKKFVKNYLAIENDTGAAATDPGYEAKQVEPKNYVPNAAIMDRTLKRLYNFFNTNENIVQSKYDENQWNAYYESEIEPLAKQMSLEFTRKLFSRRERGHGNKIIFSANSLQYASMQTKLGLVAMVDRASMRPNEWREIMNLSPVEGGDKLIMRLDTTHVRGGDNDNEDTD